MSAAADSSRPADKVIVDRHGAVLIITINRPEVRNAFDQETALGVAAAVDELDHDPKIVVGIITGAAGTFCSGMDLKAFLGSAPGERPSEIPGRGFGGITEKPPLKPLIAAVEGYALAGGCELALACDLIVAAESATFGLPEVTRGLVAGSGGAIRLARRIPVQIALEYALTGAPMAALDAHRWGLVNRLTAHGEALAGALRLATQIAANAPLSIAATKRIVAESADWTMHDAWDNQRAIVDAVLTSDDAAEGARAFAEKRPPRWTGN